MLHLASFASCVGMVILLPNFFAPSRPRARWTSASTVHPLPPECQRKKLPPLAGKAKMPTCSRPVGSVSCRLPSIGVDAAVAPPASSKSAYFSLRAGQGSSRSNSNISSRNQIKRSNDGTPEAPEETAAAVPKSNRLSWAPKQCTSPALDLQRTKEQEMAASTAETATGYPRDAQCNSSRRSGKAEQLSRTANKEWLYSLRTKLDNLLGGASSLKKSQTSPPFGFRFRSSAKTLFRHDEAVHVQGRRGNGLSGPSGPSVEQRQQQPQQQAQRQCRVIQQQAAVKHWFESVEGRSPDRAAEDVQIVACPPRAQAGSEQGSGDVALHTEEDHVNVEVFLREKKSDRLPPIPLLEAAAARFELDNQLRLQHPFLGMEENDMALQHLLTNYYTLKLSPLPQEVSLKLMMLSPHLAVFLGPENKPLLRLSALTNVKIFLIGASIEDSQRNTRYSDRGNPIYCPSREGQSDKLRLAELRGTIDAVLAAYAHLAYRLQHPWRKAVAYCVYEALAAGQRAARENRISCANLKDVDDSVSSGAAAGFAVTTPAGSAAANEIMRADAEVEQSRTHADSGDTCETLVSADEDSSTQWSVKNLELVKRLLDMPPVLCEAPQIVQGVAVENAPVRPLCIPQIARDDVWVLPLP